MGLVNLSESDQGIESDYRASKSSPIFPAIRRNHMRVSEKIIDLFFRTATGGKSLKMFLTPIGGLLFGLGLYPSYYSLQCR